MCQAVARHHAGMSKAAHASSNEETHTPPHHPPAAPLPQALEEPGQGRVLVVDGGGSKRCALLGDNIAEMAHKNGWSVSGASTACL